MIYHPRIGGMHKRRDILHGGLRWGGLLVLGGVASALGWRSRDVTCVRTNPCGACPALAGCALPQAHAAKNTTRPQSPALP